MTKKANTPKASVEFAVIGDCKMLWQSGVMHAKDPAKLCSVNVTSIKTLVLEITDADDGNVNDHADWADTKFEAAASATIAVVAPPMTLNPCSRLSRTGSNGSAKNGSVAFALAVAGDVFLRWVWMFSWWVANRSATLKNEIGPS